MCLLARACQRLWLFGRYDACGGSLSLDISFSLAPPTALTLAVAESPSRGSPCQRQRLVVSTAFDPAVTSYADVDRLLRTEPQVQLTPFVLNNHSNSLKSHGRNGPLRRVSEDGSVIAGWRLGGSIASSRFAFALTLFQNAVEEGNKAKMGEGLIKGI